MAATAAIGFAVWPFAQSLFLVVRAAGLGGPVERLATRAAHTVATTGMSVPTRTGDVAARLYAPDGRVSRTTLLVPGIHAAGIDEPRVARLAGDLAASGVAVVTMALPDLQAYLVTPRSTDVIEDAIAWLAGQPEFAPDGRVGVVGVSFAGGLAVVAAGRPSVRDRVAYVVSFGGHANLTRVMRYLSTGDMPSELGLPVRPPHDYGVAVMLYDLAAAVVPPEQVPALRDGVRTFLIASQETLVDRQQAARTFARARDMAEALPEPSATYLRHVNERDVAALGRVLEPHLAELGTDHPALSPELAASAPASPVFLLHGYADTVIPAIESVRLARHLEGRAHVALLLSRLITHAEADQNASAADAWKLVAFWARILRL